MMAQRTNFKMEYENITMTSGDTVAFNVEMTDFEGNPITVDEASFLVLRPPGYTATAFELTIGHGITQEEGLLTVRIPPGQTSRLNGDYFFKFSITVNDDVFTIKKGLLTIEGNGSY